MSAFLSPLRPGLRMATTARAFSTSPAHSVARLTLTGRLGAEPELQATSSGQEIIKYTIATSSGPVNNRHTSWFRITNFASPGPGRDLLLGLQKGTLLYVEGDARMNTYEDNEGRQRSTLSVVQRNMEVLKRPENNSDSEESR
ncbi:Primosome PriB/single-strand DNA-binding [Penicillium sp. DV-2018c]|nr:Primosome PriB/single-strand DNA-binding [Penicillium sp. DV-2018c]